MANFNENHIPDLLKAPLYKRQAHDGLMGGRSLNKAELDRLMSLGEVISDVARQIRNPLSAISSELDLLRRDAELGKPVGARVEAVRNEIGRLDKAVEALSPFMAPQDCGPNAKSPA